MGVRFAICLVRRTSRRKVMVLAGRSAFRHDRHMRNKARARRLQRESGSAWEHAARERTAADLAGAIGNSGMQQLARSAELQRSSAAAWLFSGRPATLARRPREQDEIAEGLGMPETMEEWLWQQQGMWEETHAREDELLKYLETRWERDDELPREDELRRRDVFHPPPVVGY